MKKTSDRSSRGGRGPRRALGRRCGDAANTNTVNANRVNSNTTVVVNATTRTSPTPHQRAPTTATTTRAATTRRTRPTTSAEAKNTGESIGQGLEDGWIHFKMRAALAAVDDLRDSTINVDVDNDVVTLRGSVGNAAREGRRRERREGIDGRKSVKNNLAVKAAGSGTQHQRRQHQREGVSRPAEEKAETAAKRGGGRGVRQRSFCSRPSPRRLCLPLRLFFCRSRLKLSPPLSRSSRRARTRHSHRSFIRLRASGHAVPRRALPVLTSKIRTRVLARSTRRGRARVCLPDPPVRKTNSYATLS